MLDEVPLKVDFNATLPQIELCQRDITIVFRVVQDLAGINIGREIQTQAIQRHVVQGQCLLVQVEPCIGVQCQVHRRIRDLLAGKRRFHLQRAQRIVAPGTLHTGIDINFLQYLAQCLLSKSSQYT